MGWLCRLNRLVGAVIFGAQWLALPLILLLFLQWPMRDVVRAYSREANDLGQIFFALFVAVSVTAANSRRHSPICGCRGAALFTATAALHQESRRPRRSYALGIICSDREQIHRDLLTEVTRVLPRHRELGLLCHQTIAMDHGGDYSRPGVP